VKEEKGTKDKRETNKVQNQTTLIHSVSAVKTVRLLQHRTNQLREMTISSLGQYAPIQPPTKVHGHLPYSQAEQQSHITEQAGPHPFAGQIQTSP